MINKIIYPLLLLVTGFGYILEGLYKLCGLITKPLRLLKWPLNRLYRRIYCKFNNCSEDYYE